MSPLEGVRVLDFSTLVPGPHATLPLAEAGADVLKVERPGSGHAMRDSPPGFGDSSANFARLNRGKTRVSSTRPSRGTGSTDRRRSASHDPNYLAEDDLLALTPPAMPPVLTADILGGADSTVIFVLLALRSRDATGEGMHLDLSMDDNLLAPMYAALGEGWVTGCWQEPGQGFVTVASPRYRPSTTSDGEPLAVAPLEDHFGERSCEIVEVPDALRDDTVDPEATIAGVERLIAIRTAAEWGEAFSGEDVCCSLARRLDAALEDPHVAARGLLDEAVEAADATMPGLPLPLAPVFRSDGTRRSPALGEHDAWSTAAV